MNIRFNIEKSQRKALAQKIGELAEMDVRYCGVPSCAYEIGFFTLSAFLRRPHGHRGHRESTGRAG